MARLTTAPAIVILGPGALATARRIQVGYTGAHVHALQSRVEADVAYTELGVHLRDLYARGTPLIVLCAAGIVIRALAPLLANKGAEPPVLAVAEDGSAVVPLLGGLAGVNVMAREIAAALEVAPAITTSGELRFGTCVLNPPPGYALASLDEGKRFVSDLLAGAPTRIEGEAPWLDGVGLPREPHARHVIRVTPGAAAHDAHALVIHPRSVIVAVDGDGAQLAARISAALDAQGLAPLAVAALIAPARCMHVETLADVAAQFDMPLRFADENGEREGNPAALLDTILTASATRFATRDGIALALAATPPDPLTLGHARGRVSVIGLGPGRADLMTPAARRALDEATDVLGYATYVEMAGPLREDQQRHATDNREELQRARHAFELASEGRRVVVVSSGDPGVFAMAAAVLEALDGAADPRWHSVELAIVPGVSAALATAAEAGAPLGHDFCMLSLSDNLKPWSVIETRLQHAAAADLVMAFYNPISRARPWQLERALEIVRAVRPADTRVVLGRDIGRPAARLTTTTLGALRPEQVDMRTMVIVGSSTTRAIARPDGREWIYTPRWYPG